MPASPAEVKVSAGLFFGLLRPVARRIGLGAWAISPQTGNGPRSRFPCAPLAGQALFPFLLFAFPLHHPCNAPSPLLHPPIFSPC